MTSTLIFEKKNQELLRTNMKKEYEKTTNSK